MIYIVAYISVGLAMIIAVWCHDMTPDSGGVRIVDDGDARVFLSLIAVLGWPVFLLLLLLAKLEG